MTTAGGHPMAWLTKTHDRWRAGCDVCEVETERSDYQAMPRAWKLGHDSAIQTVGAAETGQVPATLDDVVAGLKAIEQLLTPQQFYIKDVTAEQIQSFDPLAGAGS